MIARVFRYLKFRDQLMIVFVDGFADSLMARPGSGSQIIFIA